MGGEMGSAGGPACAVEYGRLAEINECGGADGMGSCRAGTRVRATTAGSCEQERSRASLRAILCVWKSRTGEESWAFLHAYV
ncbi:hypothetical protein IEQ34_019063 [Dendrobium chrysotoxum]|uniref:Uncharacterized protein n=1 Tax=Dendrobium chrysotoxum TaxID=161865 RepID=A0AAV7G7F6_DENCH|nr:hypothetical protein IEQ34_019063 [Dendrobium chrysotoxum]